MPPESDLQASLATARAHIQKLTQQLASERDTARQTQAQLQTQLEQQQQRINKLEAQEAIEPHLFACNPQPMWVYDLETLRFLAVNAAAIAKYGYSKAEFLAMTIAEIRPPEEVPRLLENVAQVDQGLDWAGIWQHCLRDGQIIQVEITSYALEFAGRRAELVMARDMTAQIQAEQALQRSEERYRFWVEFAPQLIWGADVTGRNFYVSPRMEAYLGIPAEQLLNFDWEQVVHPADLARVHGRWMESVQTGILYETEYRMRRADGEYRWHLVQAIRVQHGPENEWLGMATEIHDRKQAELTLADLNQVLSQCNQSLEQTIRERTAALSASEARLQCLLDASLATTYSCRPDGNYACTYISNNVVALLGYTATAFQSIPDLWQRQLHPDDAPQMWARLARLETDGIVKHDYRLRHRDGHYIWVHDELTLLRDAAGQPTEVVGYVVDISDRKQVEQTQQNLTDRLTLALQAGAIGTWDWNMLDDALWDDRMYAIYGLQGWQQPVTYQDWRDRVDPADIDRVEEQLQAAAVTAMAFNVEFRIRRPNGELRWVQAIAKTYCDNQGKPIRMVGINHDITDRKRTEIELRTSEEELRLFIAASSDIIYRMSADWQEIQPLDGKSLIASVDQPSRSWMDTYIPPAEQSKVWATIQARIADRQPYELEHQIIRKDGTLGWVFSRAIPMLDAQGDIVEWFGAASDISDRKQVEHQLQTSRAYFQSIITDQTELICRFLPDGTLTFVNQAYCQFFQKSPEELIGRRFSTFLPEGDQDIVWQHFRHLSVDHPVVTYDHRVIAPDGSVHWQQWTDRGFFAPDGTPLEYQAVGHDITTLKAAEAQLRHSNQELQRATRLKDEFLANMSHELRTPLNAILGMTEGLQEEIFGCVNEKQHQALRTVEKSANHLLSLINDILDVAKIESGQINLVYSSVPVAHLCFSSLAFVKQQALKKRIQLVNQVPADLPALFVDETRMRQVLLNLLTNAVKFTPEGGTVTLAAALISPDPATSQPAALHLTVTDNGIGIAAEDIPKLFKPFVQIDSALNRQQTGTGLGLALVKKIVELHGGQVRLTSQWGVGSCFTLDLPYCPEAVLALSSVDSPTFPKSTPPASEVLPGQQSPLILLAEDNPDNVITFSSYLEARGYRLVFAQDGQQALDLALSRSPDLILMDVQMPGMDGLEAIRRIRQQESPRATPIIALTALAMQGDRERCLAAGADDYLSKPVRLKQLNAVIQEQLARHQTSSMG